MNKILGIVLIVLGLAIAIVPQFTDCASQGAYMTVMGKQMPMTCHWAARAEIALGAPIAVIGAVMSFTRKKSGFYTLSILGVVLGGLAVFLPGNIISTCPTPTMSCNTLMRPTLYVLGSLVILGSGAGFLLGRKAAS